VSTGKVKLPDVRGKKLSVALSLLNQAQFTDTPQSQQVTNDPKQDGLIADESPTPGIPYPTSTTIHLTVYKYLPPTPTCTSSSPTGTGSSSSGPPTGASSSTTTLPPCTSSS